MQVQDKSASISGRGAALRSTRTLDAASPTLVVSLAVSGTGSMPTPIHSPGDISPGELYEDCSFHPCLCLRVDGDEISGVSLVDGSYPRACDIGACGVRKLTLEEAQTWKLSGPQDLDDESKVSDSNRWW